MATRFARLHLRHRLPRPRPPCRMTYGITLTISCAVYPSSAYIPTPAPPPSSTAYTNVNQTNAPTAVPSHRFPSHSHTLAPYFLVVSTKCCFISLWRYLRSGVLCRVALGSRRSRANKLKLTPTLPVPLSRHRSLLPYIFLQY